MQNVIIGTAGHVDHGKSALIRALTGVETDRLPEEQKKKITIELGFASLPNDQGQTIGIIDVPGHEKFVNNMLAGIGGIDLVLLIVALDESVMPQTREHFEILKALHIENGLIVLTKSDLVEEDWASLVEEEVRDLVKGSFLEDAPMIRVSAKTGENIERLRQMILDRVKEIGHRRLDPALFRLPVDRVFTVKGFGTVVTGTLIEGSVKLGEEVEIYPEGPVVRVRGIQNHGREEAEASAGQRTALNLSNISKEGLERGEIIARPGSMIPSCRVDAKIKMFDHTARLIRYNDPVRVAFGASEQVARAMLLDQDQIKASEEAFVQFHFDEPVTVRTGDRLVVRFFSPLESIGGGEFLNPSAPRHKKKDPAVLESLRRMAAGGPTERVEEIIRQAGAGLIQEKELAVRANLTRQELAELTKALEAEGRILGRGGGWLHRDLWDQLLSDVQSLLEAYHAQNPMQTGMDKAEFLNRIGHEEAIPHEAHEAIIQALEAAGRVVIRQDRVALPGFEARYSEEMIALKEAIQTRFREAAFEPPTTQELLADWPAKQEKAIRQILADLDRRHELIKIDASGYMDWEAWNRILALVYAHVEAHGSLSLPDFRDQLSSSRKYALRLLEALEARKILQNQGEVRVLLKKEALRQPISQEATPSVEKGGNDEN